MAVCTNTEVFDYMQTPSDVRTAEGSRITSLITLVTDDIEKDLGRKIESTSFSNILFQHGYNCEIYGTRLYFKGIYRDIYSITTITEEGVTLTAKTDYDDGSDYILDSAKGMMIRQDTNWSRLDVPIKITGKLGLVNSDNSVLDAIKLAVIESVAARSGLWTTEIITAEGTIQQTRTNITKETRRLLNKYKTKRLC